MFSKFIPLIYVQISPELLTLKNIHSGMTLSEPAQIAISTQNGRNTVLATGKAATQAGLTAGAKVIKPFAHPRILISDFSSAETLLREQLKKVLSKSWIKWAPILVIHPTGNLEGGLTDIELRALREFGLGAGAKTVLVWIGRPLTDHEVITRQPLGAAGTWY